MEKNKNFILRRILKKVSTNIHRETADAMFKVTLLFLFYTKHCW